VVLVVGPPRLHGFPRPDDRDGSGQVIQALSDRE
jgi:hypothetical protein